VGLFARDDEVPYWIHAWDVMGGVLFLWLPTIGIGIFCLVIGNALGQAIGAVLVVGGGIWATLAIRDLRRRRAES
jgi:hypothetical protein